MQIKPCNMKHPFYIFLDIDGVLYIDGYCGLAIARINEFIEYTGGRVVISSDRRHSREALEYTFDKLTQAGFTTNLKDVLTTPKVKPSDEFFWQADVRREEIHRFLKERNHVDKPYVIIDDLDLNKNAKMPNPRLVKTDKKEGFTHSEYINALKVFHADCNEYASSSS